MSNNKPQTASELLNKSLDQLDKLVDDPKSNIVLNQMSIVQATALVEISNTLRLIAKRIKK